MVPRENFQIAIGLVVLLSMTFSVRLAKGQFTTSSLSGVVTDSSGASVSGAAVTVLNTATGATKTSSTGFDGSYLFPALMVGTYQLSIEKQGFETYVQSGIVLTVNQAATQSVKLQIGATSQQVSVSANTTMLTTDTAAVSHLIDERQILDLPLDGRHAESLVFLAPGTVNSTNNYCLVNCQGGVYPSSQEAVINGGGTQNVTYEMDGTEHNDTYVSTNLPFPNPDAVQEFSLQSNNMSAEYGNSATVVSIVTKSGTNIFHGDVFEFLRNGDLNGQKLLCPCAGHIEAKPVWGSAGRPHHQRPSVFLRNVSGDPYHPGCRW